MTNQQLLVAAQTMNSKGLKVKVRASRLAIPLTPALKASGCGQNLSMTWQATKMRKCC